MSRVRALWRRILNRDLVEESERKKDEFVRSETEGRVEMYRFLADTSTRNKQELAGAGLVGRASAEELRAREAAGKARLLEEHRDVYGDDPLLNLLGGPGAGSSGPGAA